MSQANTTTIESSEEHHGVSVKNYVTGFLLSLLLTAIAFGVVMSGKVTGAFEWGFVIASAVAQIYVQLHYFLHLDGSNQQRWNVMSLIYTLIIILFLVVGSLWIMYNTRMLMMPGV